jgi:transcription initiation factor TFIID subunit TAF12
MDIYYKQNTGLETPQGHNLDYFSIKILGNNYTSSTSFAEIVFYQFLEDAQSGKPANAQRTCEWNPMSDCTSVMVANLFSFDSITTTSGDTITLLNPTQQDG